VLLLGVVTFCVAPLRACMAAPGFLDDGPFHGTPCTDDPRGETPVDAIDIVGFRRLEVYARREPDAAPRLVLREPWGSVRWCRIADGDGGGSVERIDLGSATATAIPGIVAVNGSVVWTFGHERATWLLTWPGDLYGYWYSW
jgi:hypothetical protein